MHGGGGVAAAAAVPLPLCPEAGATACGATAYVIDVVGVDRCSLNMGLDFIYE